MQDSGFYRKVARIAIPVALQGLVSSSLTLLDNMMVSSLSETALSSVNLGVQLFNIQWMMVFGFCTGCSTFLTQFWGAKDIRNIRRVMGFAMVNAMVLSLIFFCLGRFFPLQVMSIYTRDPAAAALGAEYLKTASVNFLFIAVINPLSASLRATQQTRIPMFISFGAFVTDLFFNYCLIFGHFGFPRLEVRGAALATVMARALEFTLMVLMVFARKNPLRGPLKGLFAFDRNLAARVYKNSVFTTLNETLWSGANSAMSAAYGHIGTLQFAAFSASITVMNLFLMCMFSLGDASLILIGARIGEGKKDEAFETARRLRRLALIMGTCAGVLIAVFAGIILKIFDLSPEGFTTARQIMYVHAVFCPLNLTNGVMVSGILRAGGDTRFAAITEILLMWLISVPLAFIGALWLKLPITIVVLMVSAETVIKFFVLRRRFRSGKWLNYMIEGL
ncbi:MAG: MATE family efflux transporter [Firmicutes bacterium]|nr:MATE family efflux transporter [Bacillota bacterium]